MAESFVLLFLRQLLFQAPQLIACLVGLVLALTLWHRHPRPSLFTMLAMIGFLLSTLVQSLLYAYLVHARDMNPDWTHERISTMMSINALAGSVLRAGAFALLFVAVYVGRNRTQ